VGKLDAAVDEYREAIRLSPDEATFYNNLGGTLVDLGKVEEAMPLIREALRLKPDSSSHSTLADALDKQGKLEESIAEYRAAVRLQPDSHSDREWLAHGLRRQGKLDEAIEEFRIASRIDPSCTYVRRSLGECLLDQGKLDLALATCQESLRLQPDDNDVHQLLRAILKRQGKLDEVIADCREMIRLKPDDAGCQNWLAWELVLVPGRSRREYDGALAHSRKAVELAPKQAYIVNTLALAELRVGHWAECIAAAERSMALNGGDTSDRFFLAMAHWQKGDQAEARKWFDKAVAWTRERDPKNAELRGFWKEAAALLGQPGPAADGTNSPTATSVEKPR
jgi:tetratricopeptide (TPR) repeat protein